MADWSAVTRALDSTALTGAQNIGNVTGVPFTTVVSRWALATYVTDGGGVPPELQYDSWNLHAVYSSLHSQNSGVFPNFYPLVPPVSTGWRALSPSGSTASTGQGG